MKSIEELEARVSALESLMTIMVTAHSIKEGIPDKEASLLFKAAYGEAEKAKLSDGLIGLDLMFERVMRFIHGS